MNDFNWTLPTDGDDYFNNFLMPPVWARLRANISKKTTPVPAWEQHNLDMATREKTEYNNMCNER